MNSKVKKEILVFAHDAGGGEIIGAYLKAHPKSRFRPYVAGPAARVFKRLGLSFSSAPHDRHGIAKIIAQHQDAAYLLTATGWMTSTERYALLESKKRGIKTCVYMESWNNYRERFGYPHSPWKENLPDELWVGDTSALLLAKRLMPRSLKIRFVKNEYFALIIRHYRALKKTKTKYDVLFMSDVAPGAEKNFGEFLSSLEKQKKNRSVLIRFHPADRRSKYDSLIRAHKNILIEKSREKDIVLDIARSRIVIGAETVAMVAPVIVGKKTISLTSRNGERFLPFREILRVRRAKDAANLI